MLVFDVARRVLFWWFVISYGFGLGWIGLCLICRVLLRVYPHLAHAPRLRLGA
jgi:hypothetical protein